MSEFDVALLAEIPPLARMWRNQEEIWKWCRQTSGITRAAHDEWLQRIETDASIRMFGISGNKGKKNGSTWNDVGVCGFTSIDCVNQKAEFSLYIAPEHQKKGYGQSALQLLLEHGFHDLNLNRIWGEMFEGNPAEHMFKKVGMSLEGIQHQAYFRNGRFIDSKIFGITRNQFNARYYPNLTPVPHTAPVFEAEKSKSGSTCAESGAGEYATTARSRKAPKKAKRK